MKSRILGPDGQPIDLEVLGEEISAPSVSGIRQVWHSSVAGNLTPPRLAQLLQSAAEGDAHDYLTLAEEMEERDMHYASVLGTRKLAIVGLEVQIEAASDAAADVRIADAVREVVRQAEFAELAADQVDAIGKAYAVSEIVWDRSGKTWWPRFEMRDPRWFRFDRDTGRQLRLLDEADPSNGVPLLPYKYVVHRPRIRGGLPIRGGLARLAAPAYMCKAWSWRDWMAFADIYGMPMRVGTYSPNAKPDDIRKLMAAVANLGSDAAAVVPQSTKITFEQAANVAGAGDFFEKLATYWDKQISKGVIGQTMTSDDGASLSQAQVHDLVRRDILEHDARALSNTLQRDLVGPFVRLNFGEVALPRLRIVVPKPEDTRLIVEALAKLVPLGLRVEQSVIRDKLGLPDPPERAEVLAQPSAAAPVAAAAPALNRAANSAQADPDLPDALMADRLATETEPAWAAVMDRIRDLVNEAESLESLRDALLGAFADLPQQQLTQAMAMGFAAAELAGRWDAVGDSGAAQRD